MTSIRENFLMAEVSKGYSAENAHGERVHEIARLIGGYIRNVVQDVGVTNFVGIVHPDEFPNEVRAAVDATRSGARDRRIRSDPYLAFAFPLLQHENYETISGELVANSSEIAFYATGDLTYAQKVREHMQTMEAEHQNIFT